MEILAAVIGGFLAAGTGWLLQKQTENTRLRRLKELLIIGVIDDLNTSLELYDRLRDDWDKSQTIWFTTISEFTESRHTYANNKDWISLIDSGELRKKIFRYYRQSANYLLQMHNAQQQKYNIQSKFNNLVQNFMAQQTDLAYQDAQTRALNLMQTEIKDLTGLNETIPKLLNQLERFKNDAKEILKELQNV